MANDSHSKCLVKWDGLVRIFNPQHGLGKVKVVRDRIFIGPLENFYPVTKRALYLGQNWKKASFGQ